MREMKSRVEEALVLSGSRVLLIEPSSELVGVISQALGDNGATMALISTVPLAVKHIAEKPTWTDVLVVGPSIEAADCKQLVTEIRESLKLDRQSLPLVLVTRFGAARGNQAVLPHLFDAHVANPTDARQLVGALQRVLAAKLDRPRFEGRHR